MIEFFKYLNSLHPLSGEATAALMRVIRAKELRKGQVWLQEGAVCDRISFIEKGLVKLYFESGNKELVLAYRREREIILSIHSYFTQTPSAFSIRTVEPCTLFYVTHADMQYFEQKFVDFNINMRVILQHFNIISEQHLGILLLSPKLRLEKIREMYPWMGGDPRITDKMLAALIGVTPACMSYYINGRTNSI